MLLLGPHAIPPSLKDKKVANLGDGFIEQAIEKQLGRPALPRLSPRIAHSRAELEAMRGQTLIIGGANQLNDRYEGWPGLSLEDLEEFSLRLIPFGVGLHGEPSQCVEPSPKTRLFLMKIHSKLKWSSWRCPATVRYLQQHIPEIAPKLLMTGCPVLYDAPVLEGHVDSGPVRTIAVTVTDRGDFYAREWRLLSEVAKRFPTHRRLLILHQDFLGRTHCPQDTAVELRAFRQSALKLGYELVDTQVVEQAMELYRNTVDLHFGSRLHAHLFMLSQGKRSYVIGIDDRVAGMAEHFEFEAINPADVSSIVISPPVECFARIRDTYPVMQRFLGSIS
jgi:hypothetical protein